ncbi:MULTISPECIES: GNAT family N-acetyltransferase [unclassified Burkholderia]|uniref:GNAT family N-acetyltransferase n=1 Tax=unclassified Burkholderia TaxID=2613784 RepID=UPI000F597A81|nr:MULTISPECIES: GNAT family N-acetyltransferase [unclassified Burkholderia]RQS62286.1 GNAT family N-acetyltransferase [Burkholderia sp. Bp8984]RQZ27589.1 GNAT family N-acetyltransferase [Burkholderia sp. Bp9090]
MPENRTITLRNATPHDAEHIARLHTLSWQNAYSHILPAAYLADEVPTEHATRWRNYFDRAEAEWGLVLIAESDGAPVGFVSAERPVDPARGVLLDCLHVHPAHHGSGTGKRMIEAVRAWARHIGEDKVHLSVLDGNVRAIGFYEHNGWRLAGVETSFIGRTEVADRIYVIDAGTEPQGGTLHDRCR